MDVFHTVGFRRKALDEDSINSLRKLIGTQLYELLELFSSILCYGFIAGLLICLEFCEG